MACHPYMAAMMAMSNARLFPTQSKWMNLNITLKWYDQSHRGWCISPCNVAPNHGKHHLPMAVTKCIQIWFERIVHHDLNWILFNKSITLLQVGCVVDHAVTSGSELSSCTLSSPSPASSLWDSYCITVRWRQPVNCLSSKWLKCVVGCLLPTNSNNMPGMLAGPGPNELEGVWPSELCLWCARHLRMSTWELLCPARCLWPGQSTIIIVMSFH